MPLIPDEVRAHVDAAGPAPGAEHPHRPRGPVPVRLPRQTLQALSELQPWRSVAAAGAEWLCIGATIATALALDHPLVTAAAIVVIGARQHALMVLGHEAAHYRFLPDRRLNDWVAELFVAWPVFMSARFFRITHTPHHQHLGTPRDGNRRAWRTHTPDGALVAAWRYPKARAQLLAELLKRGIGVVGVLWIVRYFVAPLALRRPAWEVVLQYGYHGLLIAAVTAWGLWPQVLLYWLLPYVTWHIVAQHVRLICEHSGAISDQEGYALTRSTHPGWLGRFLVLPRHIGHHLEHHWFPSVPWYNLPALHTALSADPDFARHANVQPSIRASLSQCLAR